jgi:hypothetical protein
LAAWVAGLVVALAVLLWASAAEDRRLDELALGAATTSVFASRGQHPIHCSTIEDANGCIEGVRHRGSQQVVLWLGNSQLHAVNQHQPGQVTAVAALAPVLDAQHRDLVAFSQPNANLQEHLLLFAHLKRVLPLEWVILPAVFDDLRETGIRPKLAPALGNAATRDILGGSAVGRQILASAADAPEGDLAALRQTVQESAEAELNRRLESSVSLWARRPQLRGRLFTALYELRNTAFGITAQSKRRIIPGRYSRNMAALEQLLDMAARDGIRVLVYIVPLRDDVDTPYDASEYDRFRREIERLARRHGARFANFARLVPSDAWGMKSSTDTGDQLELDFMHFQAHGHALLARAVGEQLGATTRHER